MVAEEGEGDNQFRERGLSYEEESKSLTDRLNQYDLPIPTDQEIRFHGLRILEEMVRAAEEFKSFGIEPKEAWKNHQQLSEQITKSEDPQFVRVRELIAKFRGNRPLSLGDFLTTIKATFYYEDFQKTNFVPSLLAARNSLSAMGLYDSDKAEDYFHKLAHPSLRDIWKKQVRRKQSQWDFQLYRKVALPIIEEVIDAFRSCNTFKSLEDKVMVYHDVGENKVELKPNPTGSN